jgi:D-arabinose 1-dehydrogenase-like Zn-dependent alcohol dehydrogenase
VRASAAAAEVRERMKTAGVCHSDLHVIKGDLAMSCR